MQANGFLLYYRREGVGDGPTRPLPSNCNIKIILDNIWVEPYNPYLSK